MTTAIKIDGLEELIKSFNTMADPAAYVHLEGAVREGALEVRRKAKLYAPVNSGKMKKAISSRKRRTYKKSAKIMYDVGPRDVKHSGFVLLGHRIKGTGRRTTPNDFMKRAAEDTRQQYIDLAVRTLTQDIDRLGGK